MPAFLSFGTARQEWISQYNVGMHNLFQGFNQDKSFFFGFFLFTALPVQRKPTILVGVLAGPSGLQSSLHAMATLYSMRAPRPESKKRAACNYTTRLPLE